MVVYCHYNVANIVITLFFHFSVLIVHNSAAGACLMSNCLLPTAYIVH